MDGGEKDHEREPSCIHKETGLNDPREGVLDVPPIFALLQKCHGNDPTVAIVRWRETASIATLMVKTGWITYTFCNQEGMATSSLLRRLRDGRDLETFDDQKSCNFLFSFDSR